MLFAIFPDQTQRYHLTTESGRTTLCGFPTCKSKLLDAERYPPAQITPERPDSLRLSLCPTCEATGDGTQAKPEVELLAPPLCNASEPRHSTCSTRTRSEHSTTSKVAASL